MLRLIDQERWERKKHYEYYTDMLPCGYCVTVRLDVTNLYRQVKDAGYKFYPAFIYCVSKAVNGMKEFRMGRNSQGEPGIWDEVHPNYTIFHEDDHTFSDVWSYYDEDFEKCYHNITEDMEKYKDCKGPKVKGDQPANFYCISCVPWMDFIGYSTWVPGGTPNLFPIITFGKYAEEEGRKVLSASLTISHAAADGYHTSMLFQKIQKILDEINVEKSDRNKHKEL